MPDPASRRRPIVLRFLFLAAMLGAAAARGEVLLTSGPGRVSLIELYTSEGCSSCPPADRWFSRLRRDPALWTGFVPIALHVDYWDDLGWRDRFADPAFSARERSYARSGSLPTVYTPGVVLDGGEWRGWYVADTPPASSGAGGVLTLRMDGQRADVSYDPAGRDAADGFVANVALLGFGLTSRVTAGENDGRTLAHDFVALEVRQADMSTQGHRYRASLRLQGGRAGGEMAGIAAWISTPDSPAPRQALGGWLPVCGRDTACETGPGTMVGATHGRAQRAGITGNTIRLAWRRE